MVSHAGGDLWKPKKTLRDWGRTEYRIVRNWTPRELREARNNVPPPSLAEVSHSSHQEEEEDNGQELPLVDVEQEGDEEETLLEPAVDKSLQSSLLSIQQRRDSPNQTPSQMSGGEGSVSRGITPRKSESRRERLSSSSSREPPLSLRRGAWRDSGTGHGNLPEGREEGDASLVSSPPGGSLSGRGGQREEEASEESQMNSEELEVTLSPPAKRTTTTSPSKGKRQAASASKGRGGKTTKKTAAKGRVRVKLWRPRHVKRTARDLHELDVCLTVYDKMVREALESADSLVVERLLANHWKHTTKHMLGMIRDVHTVVALNKRLKKERAKYRQLQKHHIAALKALRRTNGDYNKAVGKAEKAQKREQLSVQAEEIERLTEELQPYFEHYRI